jgi:hypothetical protein
MKKILFFTEDDWAFGSLHHGLEKELYKNGIYSNVLDWRNLYTIDEIAYLVDHYDYFVTSPGELMILINYGVPLEKVVTIAHAAWDIFRASSLDIPIATEHYSKLHNYAVINPELQYVAKYSGCAKEVKLVKNGVHFDYLYRKPSQQLLKVGYAAQMETVNFFQQKIKRGYLVEKAAELSGLEFKPNGKFKFLCVPGYYNTVDCVIQSSIEEACGLPMLEAAAAGRLCIGTSRGYFKHNADNGGGIKVRLDDDDFVADVIETFEYYKANPEKYKQKCLDIQEYARYNYDWKYVIDGWIELFN